MNFSTGQERLEQLDEPGNHYFQALPRFQLGIVGKKNCWRLNIIQTKGPFTQAIFVTATQCNFHRRKIALGFKHVRSPWDIAATNRTWFTPAILKLKLKREKNCIELLRQKTPV